MLFGKIRRFPWDWQTPTGYFLAVIIQYIQTVYLFLFASISFSIGIGGFLFGNTVMKDMCAIINSINDNAQFDGNRTQMMEQLSQLIETHSFALELSEMHSVFGLVETILTSLIRIFRFFYEFFNIIKLICTVFLTWCLVVICASLLLFQEEIVE